MDGAITLLLVVGAICLVVLAWAGRKRFPLRIGAGNFFRRKTQVAIVVAGLLIGTAIGFDSGRDLGDFVRADGSRWNGAGLGATEAIINDKLATAVEAKVGQGLVVSMGTPRGNAQMSLTVKEIVRDEGRGAWNDNENLFVPLGTIQAALGDAGQINTITVANVGGVTQGYLRSDEAGRAIATFLPPSPTVTVSKAQADSIAGGAPNIG